MAKRKRSRSRVPPIPAHRWTTWSDGACAGNPGPMGIGGIVRGPDGAIVRQFSERLPGTGTNNIAEWKAFSRAITLAAECGATDLICHADSELVVRQFAGAYAVRQDHLIPLYSEARREARRIPGGVTAVWIPRKGNGIADGLASAAVGMPQTVLSATGEETAWVAVAPRDDATLPPLSDPLRQALIRFRVLREPRFADFLALKTGGRDPYSRLSVAALTEAVTGRWGEASLTWLRQALDETFDQPYGRTVLRWAARGLTPPAALKKASVDTEMAQRHIGGKRAPRTPDKPSGSDF